MIGYHMLHYIVTSTSVSCECSIILLFSYFRTNKPSVDGIRSSVSVNLSTVGIAVVTGSNASSVVSVERTCIPL